MDTVGLRVGRRTGDIIVPGPKVHIGGIEDGEKREPPADSVNDDLFATLKELIDDRAEKEKVDERPGSRNLA